MKDNLNVRIYRLEQVKPFQAFLRDREVVFFGQAEGPLALQVLMQSVVTASKVNYFRPVKLGFTRRRIEKALVNETNKLGAGWGDRYAPRVMEKDILGMVDVLSSLVPSYQVSPLFDTTPAGAVGVMVCRLPYVEDRNQRDPFTTKEIDKTISMWEALNETFPDEEPRKLVMLFI